MESDWRRGGGNNNRGTRGGGYHSGGRGSYTGHRQGSNNRQGRSWQSPPDSVPITKPNTPQSLPSTPRDFEDIPLLSRQTPENIKELEESSLRNPKVQEDLLAYIKTRGEKDGKTKDELNHIVGLFRKLREGLLSSGRCDAFAVQVYEASADASLHAENYGELLKTLTVLVNQIYPALLPSIPLPRRLEMLSYYILYFICFSTTSALPYGDTPTLNMILAGCSDGDFKGPEMLMVMKLLRVVKMDLHYREFGKIWASSSIKARVLLTLLLPRVRLRTWTILSKSFYTFGEPELKRLLLWGEGAGENRDDKWGWRKYVDSTFKPISAQLQFLDNDVVQFREAKRRK
ncbi:hypothetical protein HDU97_008236 [Phlyctochytrium planicorne]|nr:hypothetical protein HDU97_008236 [Phlyctochytrium planicorne]